MKIPPGLLHSARGRFDQATSSLKKALRSDPEMSEASLALAETYMLCGRGGDAIEQYRNTLLVERYVRTPSIYISGFVAHFLNSAAAKVRQSAYYGLAKAYQELTEYGEAISCCQVQASICANTSNLANLIHASRCTGGTSRCRR